MENSNRIEGNEEVELNTEDKIRIIKSMILLFLFSSMIVSSMTYYNAPNINPNLVFDGSHDNNAKHDKHIHNNPIYKLNSRYIMTNQLELNIVLERVGRNNNINSDYYRNIKMIVKFSKNKARIKILENESKEKDPKPFEVPSNVQFK